MTSREILNSLGRFTAHDLLLFEAQAIRKQWRKHDVLLNAGEVCQTVYYILSGSFFQYQLNDATENIIDLHLPNEWLFNHASLVGQTPSHTTIKAFANAEVLELSLSSIHSLIAASPAFLQLGKLFEQANHKIYLFDNSLTPAQKYDYVKSTKPLLPQVFPVKMIASYLKMAPETLSRVRANL